MPPRRPQQRSPLPKPHPLRPSKLAVAVLLLAAGMYNSRSPNHLSAADGDRPADAWVGHGHMTFGLAAQATFQLAMVGWFLLAGASPVRAPWGLDEAAAAAASLGGAALRRWCFVTLGRFFTYEVGIRRGHHLVQTGPYALLLHPSYTGTLLLISGLLYFLAGPLHWFRRPLGLLSMAALGAVVAAARIRNEEEVLAGHFGQEWEQHAAARWRLVPYVF